MSNRLALIITGVTLLVVAAVVPTAVQYGGVAPWGPFVPGGGALLCTIVIGFLLRRDDRPRVPLYAAIAVLVFCGWLTAWLVIQRLA